MKFISNLSDKNSGQGTIEYLVVLSIVVIIGLVIVGISSGFLGAGGQVVDNSRVINSVTSSGIVVREAVLDYEGTALLSLQNNSGEELTLTKISTDEVEIPYNRKVFSGSNLLFSLPNTNCACLEGNQTKNCTYDLYLKTKSGIEKKETVTIKLECVSEAVSIDQTVVNPVQTRYNLKINIFGNDGLVKVNGQNYSNELSFISGTEVNLEAISQNGWSFVNWTNTENNNSQTSTVIMNSNKDININFEDLTIYLSDCQEINEPGYYKLENNISSSLENCFNITSSNVTIDLNGKTISPGIASYDFGIIANNVNNIVIKNGTISDFGTSIYGNLEGGQIGFNNVNNSFITDINFIFGERGILLINSSNNYLHNININNLVNGIQFYNNSIDNNLNNVFVCNEAYSSGRINCDDSSNQNLATNTFVNMSTCSWVEGNTC